MKNLHRYLLIALAFMLSQELFSQILWLEPGFLETGLEDRVSKDQFEIGNQKEVLNFHSVASFNNQSELLIDVPTLEQCQIFTVFKSKLGADEALIWKLEKELEDQLLFTDHRMYDYTKSKYMNFVNHAPDQAQVYCYQHYRSDFQADKLRIGTKPNNSAIPVDLFDGNLAELIVFKRVLAPITRKAIETYLALKYSVPLQLGEDYLSMDGSKIWEHQRNIDFPNRLAGLGRDDQLQLYQKQSRSILEGGSLVIGLGDFKNLNHENLSVIQPNQYLLWSDDGNTLDFLKTVSFPKKLNRSWKLNALKFDDNQIFLHLDHKAIVNELEEDEQLWFLLSKGNETEFPIESSEIYKMNLSNSVFEIDAVVVRPDIYHFTFVKAPNFWAALKLDEISCNAGEKGLVKIKPIGGKAPYHVSLINGSSLVYENTFPTEEIMIVDELENDRYKLEIKDGNGSFYQTSLSVNSNDLDVSAIDLSTNVTTQQLQDYFQSFQQDHEIQYNWIKPNGDYSSGLDVDFDESGNYVLEMVKDECRAWISFEVSAPENNIIEMFINPNPSSTGYFHLAAQLKRTAGYSIDISNMEGKKIFYQEFTEQKYIDYHGQLSDPGVYNIRLSSNGTQLSKKLIIVN